MSTRQNVPSNFGNGGIGLTPEGSSVAAPSPAVFGLPTIPTSPDLATILWSLLARTAPAMATYAVLTAFGATNALDRQDGQVALVQQDGSLWKWAALSTLPASATVLLANDAPVTGRWVAVSFGSTTTPIPIVPVDLKGAILAAGTPLVAFSSPNVGYVVTGSKSVGVRWHTGTLTTIWTEVDLPPDMDRDFPATLSMLVSKTGATATDVVSMTVTAFVQAASFPPAVAEDASANLGGVSPALTSAQAALPAGTVTKLQLSHALLPPPGIPARLTMSFTPSGTLATDDVILEGVWLEYVRQQAPGRLMVDIRAAIIAAGTPLAAFADAVASQPGITLDNSKAVGVRFNDNATQAPVWSYIDIPYDLDVTKPVIVRGLFSKSGATVGDATTLTLTIFEQVPGALEDAGSNLGGVTSAIVGSLTAKTVSAVAYVIPANTLTAAPGHLSISVQPTSGTLGTDDGIINGLWLEYQKKPTAVGLVSFDLKAALLAAGTPMAAFADNAASNPGITLNNSKAVGIRWNDAATQVAVFSNTVLPYDFDVSQPCTLVVQVSKSGATAADTAPFLCKLWEQVPGVVDVSGPTFTGSTNAIATPAAAAKTVSRLTLAIPGSTFTQSPAQLTASIQPTSGLLGTDDLLCTGCWLEYTPKAS